MPPDTTFAEAWTAWLRYRACGSRPLRLSTLADYESVYRCHLEPHLGALPLEAIDGATVAHLVVALSAAAVRPKRLSNVLVPLRACLRWHHRMGAFPRDPSPWFDAPARAADERRILSIDQIERLIAATPAHYRCYVAFAAYTGMRAGEIRALTWSDIDLDARLVRVDKAMFRSRVQRSTKSGHDRTVPVPSHLAEMLAEWRARCPPSEGGVVFPTRRGRPIDQDTFRTRVFKPSLVRAGLPLATRFHDLRHTSASLYLKHGATVREVMEIHGWRQMQTAMRYLHVTDGLNAAADRLSAARDSVTREGERT